MPIGSPIAYRDADDDAYSDAHMDFLRGAYKGLIRQQSVPSKDSLREMSMEGGMIISIYLDRWGTYNGLLLLRWMLVWIYNFRY